MTNLFHIAADPLNYGFILAKLILRNSDELKYIK